MTKEEDIIIQGAKVWNPWREKNPISLVISCPQWHRCLDSQGVHIKGGNTLDFSGMNLSNLHIHDAFAEGLDLHDSIFENTSFEEGDFSRANFRNCTFRNTRFNKTILTDACFDDATFINCNLNRSILTGASFNVREITETVVYGISAWDLTVSEQSRQSRLVIERTYDLYSELIDNGAIPMMVDDIELAQFIHYLSSHKHMRETINVLNDRGVLLLGGFKDGGLERLYAIRDWLGKQGYMPMIFDFQRPDYLSRTETVITMAGLSKFILADLSGRSVPGELSSILNQFHKPLLFLGDPYALLPDLEDKTNVLALDCSNDDLPGCIEKMLPEIEKLYAKRILALARRYERSEQA